MANRVLTVSIIGDSASAQRAFEKTAAAANASATSMERSGAKISAFGAGMRSVGRGMTTYITAPLALVGAASVKMSFDFQRSMGLISQQAGGTKREVAKLTGEVLNLARSSQFAPNTLATGLFHIESAGYRGAKALGILNQAQRLATVGNSDFETTTYALVSAVKALGVEGIKPTTKVAAELNAIVGAGDVRLEELTASLATGVLPSFRAAGMGLRDFGASMDVLTARGIPAQRAAYSLRMSIAKLVAPSKESVKILEGLGLSQLQLAETMRHKGLLATVEELKAHLKDLSASEQTQVLTKILGGGRSSAGFLTLIQNVGELGKKYQQVGKGVHNYNLEVKEAEREPLVEMKKAWSSIQADLIELGKVIGPTVLHSFQGIASVIDDLAHKFDGLSSGTKELVVDLGIAFALGGPMISGMGVLLSGWGKLATLIGKAGRALGVFSAAETAAGVAGGVGGGALGAGATGAGVARWLGTDAAPATAATAGAFGEKAALRDAGLLSAGSGVGLLGTAALAAVPVGIGALGVYKIATKTGHEMGNTIASGLGSEFDSKFGPALEGALKRNDVGKLTTLQHKLREALNLAIAAGADESSLEPLRKKLHELGSDKSAIVGPIKDAVTAIELGGLGGLPALSSNLTKAMALTSQTWHRGTGEWRHSTVEAMQATVHSIKEGMANSTIKTKEGRDAIKRILGQLKIVQGTDPLGLAKGIVGSFQKAHGVTQGGMNRLLRDLEMMKPKAKETAQDAVLEMANQWAKGHPKIEAQVDILRRNLEHNFGKTNNRLVHGVEGAARGIAGLFDNLGGAVGSALQGIGLNVNSLLKSLGVSKGIHFGVHIVQAAGSAIGHAVSGVAGAIGGHARGGEVTRPMYIAGEEAPQWNEWVIAQNPAYRQANLGYWAAAGHDLGVPGFKKGGLPHPVLSGPEPLRSGGQHGIDLAYHAALQLLGRQRGKAAGHGGPVPPGGPRRWLAEALKTTGHYSAANLSGLYLQMMSESSGNPHAINLTDSNAAAGHPSKGLLQTIDSTFNAYKMKGHGDIWNPVDNAIAAIRYMFARYGHIVSTGHGYAKGGKVGDPSHVIGWAQHHLGNSDKWGYPGEWCGAFLGADFKAHGIEPPSGYSSAATWLNWGSPGGAGPGEVAVFGSKHVGLSLGNGQMISGNWGNKVAIASLSAAAKELGSPTYRRPPYGGTSSSTGASSAPTPKFGLAKHATPVSFAGLKPEHLTGAALGLPAPIQKLLRSPGLKFAQKLEIGQFASQLAEKTPGREDDVAAATYTLGLEESNKKRIQKALRQVAKELHGRQSTAARKRSLAKRAQLLASLASVSGEIGSAKETIAGEGGEESAAEKAAQEQKEATEKLTEAILEQKAAEEELAKQLKEQTDFAKSATATSSATAWRALADILGGQLGAATLHRSGLAGAGAQGSW